MLLGPLPSQVRTRVWLALARIAQNPEYTKPLRGGLHPLDDGYSVSYRVDGPSRTVTLVAVERRQESMALA